MARTVCSASRPSPRPIGISIASSARPGRKRWICARSRKRSEARRTAMTIALASSSERSRHGLHGKLQGKIALITGGNSGIGLATARQFVNEGAEVVITGRREAQLAAAVKEIGGNATGFQGDVSDLDDLDRLFAQIKHEQGKLDIRSEERRVGKECRTRGGA